MNNGQFVREYVYPLRDYLTGPRETRIYRLLNQSQWWSKENLIRYQFIRFKRLLNYAYSNTKYYKNIFQINGLHPDDIKSVNDIINLPVLSKEIIERNMLNGDICSVNPESGNTHKFSSGGTTSGKPTYFLRDKLASSWGRACEFRGWSWANFNYGEKYKLLF